MTWEGAVGWRGRVGTTGPDPGEKSKWKFDFKFQMNLDFGKNVRNFTKRFRRNLDMRIFPKFL
jgi:hypothetical protein